MKILCKYLFASLLLTCFACKQNRLHIDVSNISLHLHIDRFEKDIFALDTLHLNKSISVLEAKYPDFLPLFADQLIGNRVAADSSNPMLLVHFVSNKDLRMLKKDVDSLYPNLKAQTAALQDAFKHYLYYYPKTKVPQVISFISGFNNAIVTTPMNLAIGLDLFMGNSYPYYRSVQFPRYMVRTLTPEHLPVTAMKGFLKQHFPEPAHQTMLLESMIYEGKILYFLDALFPEGADSLKIGYSAKQLQWCKDNEENIWALALEKNNLFSSEKAAYEQFLADGPFTQGLSQESAPRLGMWIGWQIIRSYMNRNTKLSIPQLMKETDAQKILNESAYKP